MYGRTKTTRVSNNTGGRKKARNYTPPVNLTSSSLSCEIKRILNMKFSIRSLSISHNQPKNAAGQFCHMMRIIRARMHTAQLKLLSLTSRACLCTRECGFGWCIWKAHYPLQQSVRVPAAAASPRLKQTDCVSPRPPKTTACGRTLLTSSP
jgi:hypothetical protein